MKHQLTCHTLVAFALGSSFATLPLRAASIVVWGAEANLSQTPTDSESGLNHRPLAMTADGVLHVVWAEKDAPNQNYRIYTRRWQAAAWTSSELVVDYLATDPGLNGGAKYPALAPLDDGSLHLFWHDYRVEGINNIEIYTKSRPAGAAWDPSRTADVRLTTSEHSETNGDNGYVPVPVSAPDGALHVLWYDFRFDGSHAEILSKSRVAGGEWDLSPGDSADVRVTNDPDHSELVAVDVDSAGNLHAAWRSVDSGARILYSTRSAASGVWSAPTEVDSLGLVTGAPALAVDGDDLVHIVWPDGRLGGRALYTRHWTSSRTLSPEVQLTDPQHAADEPSLDCGADGTLHLVWQDSRFSSFNRQVFHVEKAPGIVWPAVGAQEVRVSESLGNAERPSVLAHEGGVSVLWRDDRTGNREIFYRRGAHSPTHATPLASSAQTLRVIPNPSRGPVRFARGDGARNETLCIYDTTGRVVRRLDDAPTGWDGRSASGVPVPAGVYFVRSPASGTSARMTVLR